MATALLKNGEHLSVKECLDGALQGREARLRNKCDLIASDKCVRIKREAITSDEWFRRKYEEIASDK